MKRLLALLAFASILQGSPIEFVILITSFNNEQYVARNLDSVMYQKSTVPYQVIYVNDQSTDNTGALVDAYKKERGFTDQQLLAVHNEVRLGSGGGNIYNTVHNYIEDHQVVVCVDGDDFLNYTGVLKRLEQVYQDPNIWMTYGSFVVIPEGVRWTMCGGYPEDVMQERNFREYYNVPSHLKTFRARLYKQIRREDLINPKTGSFYDKAWDMAMLFPMLEMCGTEHSYYIEDLLYIYNNDNPISDHKDTGRQEQIRLDRQIRNKERYKPLDSLFEEDPF